jgi:transposase InsO family protein
LPGRIAAANTPVTRSVLDEPQRKLLGRTERELLQQPEERTVHGMRYATRDDAIADLFAYIESLYNRSHRHSTFGYKSPTQFLHDWFMTRHERKTAA